MITKEKLPELLDRKFFQDTPVAEVGAAQAEL